MAKACVYQRFARSINDTVVFFFKKFTLKMSEIILLYKNQNLFY